MEENDYHDSKDSCRVSSALSSTTDSELARQFGVATFCWITVTMSMIALIRATTYRLRSLPNRRWYRHSLVPAPRLDALILAAHEFLNFRLSRSALHHMLKVPRGACIGIAVVSSL